MASRNQQQWSRRARFVWLRIRKTGLLTRTIVFRVSLLDHHLFRVRSPLGSSWWSRSWSSFLWGERKIVRRHFAFLHLRHSWRGVARVGGRWRLYYERYFSGFFGWRRTPGLNIIEGGIHLFVTTLVSTSREKRVNKDTYTSTVLVGERRRQKVEVEDQDTAGNAATEWPGDQLHDMRMLLLLCMCLCA